MLFNSDWARWHYQLADNELALAGCWICFKILDDAAEQCTSSNSGQVGEGANQRHKSSWQYSISRDWLIDCFGKSHYRWMKLTVSSCIPGWVATRQLCALYFDYQWFGDVPLYVSFTLAYLFSFRFSLGSHFSHRGWVTTTILREQTIGRRTVLLLPVFSDSLVVLVIVSVIRFFSICSDELVASRLKR